MVPDTYTREKLALEHRHTFAAWSRVTDRTWILASLAVGFAFSVVTAVLEGVLPYRGPPTATQVGYSMNVATFCMVGYEDPSLVKEKDAIRKLL